MTKALLEAGSEAAAEDAAAAVPFPTPPVPASLHASLMARLDRLGAAKEVAQIGAAIGRTFSHALLAAVVRQPEAELRIGDRPSHCGRFAVPPRRAAACDLPVQACPGAGRGLWHAAAQAATRPSRPYRRNPRKPIRGRRRASAGAAGASLHGGRSDREGRSPLGQSGTAVAGTLGAGRSRRAAHSCAYPDCRLARHSRAASRADPASGRAHNSTHACQRVCCAGNQGGCRAGTSADRSRPKRSESLPTIHCFCFRFSTASGPRASLRSTATLCAS